MQSQGQIQNACQSEEGALAWDRATLFGPVALEEERLEAAARNSAWEKGEQKDE